MFHGIVVRESLKEGIKVENLFKVLKEKADGYGWIEYLVEAEENNLYQNISKLQSALAEGAWYTHFYNDDSTLIVVFKEKYFTVTKNRTTWDEAIKYGEKLGIPKKQLFFVPIYFEHEEKVFK